MSAPANLHPNDVKAVVALTSLWNRIAIEVIFSKDPSMDSKDPKNPHYQCRHYALAAYQDEYTPWITKFNMPGEEPDMSALPGLIARTDGIAKSCLPGYDPGTERPHAATIEERNPIATAASAAAGVIPGMSSAESRPTRDIKDDWEDAYKKAHPPEKSSYAPLYVAGGIILLLAGVVLGGRR